MNVNILSMFSLYIISLLSSLSFSLSLSGIILINASDLVQKKRYTDHHMVFM